MGKIEVTGFRSVPHQPAAVLKITDSGMPVLRGLAFLTLDELICPGDIFAVRSAGRPPMSLTRFPTVLRSLALQGSDIEEISRGWAEVAVDVISHIVWQQRLGHQLAVLGLNGCKMHPEMVDIQQHSVMHPRRQHGICQDRHTQARTGEIEQDPGTSVEAQAGTPGDDLVADRSAPIGDRIVVHPGGDFSILDD
jgi:hypothetical protein